MTMNPYASGLPMSSSPRPGGSPRFRTPPPMFQSTPRSNFRGRGPQAPGGRQFFTPGYRGPSPHFQGRPYPYSNPPPMRGYGRFQSPGFGRNTPQHQKRFFDHGGKKLFNKHGGQRNDSNVDVSCYYKHSMVVDPWARMTPVPLKKSSSAAT